VASWINDSRLNAGEVSDLVLGLAEDDADQAGLGAEVLEGEAVVDFELVTALAGKLGPLEPGGMGFSKPSSVISSASLRKSR